MFKEAPFKSPELLTFRIADETQKLGQRWNLMYFNETRVQLSIQMQHMIK